MTGSISTSKSRELVARSSLTSDLSSAVRERVELARETQATRLDGTTLRTNADMGPCELQDHVDLDESGQKT